MAVLETHILEVWGGHAFHKATAWPELVVKDAFCLTQSTAVEVRLFNVRIVMSLA